MYKYRFSVDYDVRKAGQVEGLQTLLAAELRSEFNKKYSFSERCNHDTEESAMRFLETVEDRYKSGLMIAQWEPVF